MYKYIEGCEMAKGKSYLRYPAEFKRMALLRTSENGMIDNKASQK
ncbi:hypothetical protein NBRC116595_36770 [Aliiglaciecola sp. NS0011-25]